MNIYKPNKNEGQPKRIKNIPKQTTKPKYA